VVSGAHISVGSTAADTFIVPPAEGLGRSRTLFVVRAGACYALRLDGAHGAIEGEGKAEGKVATGARRPVCSLAELEPAAAGAHHDVLLDDGARGSLRFGEIRVLFQTVKVPLAARPQLPHSLQGRLLNNLDWAMLAIATVSLFGHMGFVAYLSRLDYPRRPSVEDIPERVVSTIIRGRIVPPDPPPPPVNPNTATRAKRSWPASPDAPHARSHRGRGRRRGQSPATGA